MSSILYTDGQLFESKKESYISVVNKNNDILFFCLIGYKTARETEGTAILKALEYFQENNILNGTIYTDSLDWAGLANGNHRVSADLKNEGALNLVNQILTLKKKLLTTIHWKRREYNLAGHFLAKVWTIDKKDRDKILTILEPPKVDS